jgi:hypothetical protein
VSMDRTAFTVLRRIHPHRRWAIPPKGPAQGRFRTGADRYTGDSAPTHCGGPEKDRAGLATVRCPEPKSVGDWPGIAPRTHRRGTHRESLGVKASCHLGPARASLSAASRWKTGTPVKWTPHRHLGCRYQRLASTNRKLFASRDQEPSRRNRSSGRSGMGGSTGPIGSCVVLPLITSLGPPSVARAGGTVRTGPPTTKSPILPTISCTMDPPCERT